MVQLVIWKIRVTSARLTTHLEEKVKTGGREPACFSKEPKSISGSCGENRKQEAWRYRRPDFIWTPDRSNKDFSDRVPWSGRQDRNALEELSDPYSDTWIWWVVKKYPRMLSQ